MKNKVFQLSLALLLLFSMFNLDFIKADSLFNYDADFEIEFNSIDGSDNDPVKVREDKEFALDIKWSVPVDTEAGSTFGFYLPKDLLRFESNEFEFENEDGEKIADVKVVAKTDSEPGYVLFTLADNIDTTELQNIIGEARILVRPEKDMGDDVFEATFSNDFGFEKTLEFESYEKVQDYSSKFFKWGRANRSDDGSYYVQWNITLPAHPDTETKSDREIQKSDKIVETLGEGQEYIPGSMEVWAGDELDYDLKDVTFIRTYREDVEEKDIKITTLEDGRQKLEITLEDHILDEHKYRRLNFKTSVSEDYDLRYFNELDNDAEIIDKDGKQQSHYYQVATNPFLVSGAGSGELTPRVSVGDYVWLDENKNGLQDEDEQGIEGVKVVLTDQNGDSVKDIYNEDVEPTVTDENGEYVFEDLPVTAEEGYYVVTIDKEDENTQNVLEGLTPTHELVGEDNSINSFTWIAESRPLTNMGERDLTLDFGFIEIDTTDVNVKKEWVLYEKEKEAVEIELIVDEKVIDTVTLSEENDWQHTFKNLEKYKDELKEDAIKYEVKEVEIEGFESKVSGDVENGYLITNTEIVDMTPLEPYADTTVQKVWKDNDNEENTRPESIEVNLLADGEVVDKIELSDDNDWTQDLKALKIYNEEDEEINYEVEEVDVPEGYKVEVNGNLLEGFTITNTLTIDQLPIIPITKVDVEKQWEGKALEEVEIVLYANGEKIKSIILSEENNWKHTFNSLPVYLDQDGEEAIEYTIDEIDVEGYEKTISGDQNEGFIVVNKEIIEDETDKTDETDETDETEDPVIDGDDNDDGKVLPKTATNVFNLLLIGFSILLISGIMYAFSRRKSIENK